MIDPQLLQAIAAAATQSVTSGGQVMVPQTANTDTLGALLGSVQPQQAPVSQMPYTTMPDTPRAVNPAISQQMMQLLLALSGPRDLQPSLGAMLGGRA